MRHQAAAGVLLFLAISGPAAGSRAQQAAPDAVVPVPTTAKVEGVPPIPASIADALAPYAEFRSAVLLGWHPTRREMLIQTAFGAVNQVHSVAGPGMARTQLTFFRDGVGGGAWYEPGGSYFVFHKDTGGGAEKFQYFRYDVATGKTTLLTDGLFRTRVPAFAHHAGLMAFDWTKRNGKDADLYVMDPANPSSVRLVAQCEGVWRLVAWSPDDSELLVVEVVSALVETHIWRVNVKTGEKKALTPRDGTIAAWSSPQYSPDGAAVYAISNRGSELPRLWRGELASGAWKPLTKDDESVEAFALSPDGRTLAVVFNRDASSHLLLLDSATLQVRVSPKLPVGQIPLKDLEWHPGGTEVAFTFGSLGTYRDVYSVNGRTGAVERWTRSELGGFNPDALPEPEIVHWKSFDGRVISGVLYRPPARFTGPRPVIINIHGGPQDTQERPRFIGRSAYFLNELGIAIVYPNVRGSDGFGTTFRDLDNGRRREDAVKDVGALLDWIGQQPTLDKQRVMVTGASYGGYMTYAVAEMYGDRIRCAFAAAGIGNFLEYFETTDPFRLQDRRAEYGDDRDPEMREFLRRISPLTNASKIRVPLFIAHGRQDARVPVAQAEEMARAVRANGVPVWLVVYDDEGHLFWAKNTNNNFNTAAWILFVQKYLLN